MYICTHNGVLVLVCVYVCVCAYVCMCDCVCIRTYVQTAGTHVHVGVSTLACVCVHACVSVPACLYVYIHKCTKTCRKVQQLWSITKQFLKKNSLIALGVCGMVDKGWVARKRCGDHHSVVLQVSACHAHRYLCIALSACSPLYIYLYIHIYIHIHRPHVYKMQGISVHKYVSTLWK